MSDHTTNEPTVKLCECGCGQPAPIAKQTNTLLGHIKGQPVRFVVGHHNKVRTLRSVADRFWEKVDKRGPDDCWPWTGAQDGHGYGQLQVGTHSNPYPEKAPRVSYVLHYGAIPDGALVCHTCDNRACVNPAHLWLGNYSDNILDCYEKERREPPPGHGKTGEDHPSASFTEDQVVAWRSEFPASGMTMTAFAQLHGIPRGTMVSILKRKNWKHIP